MILLISIIVIKIPMNIAVVFHMTHLSDACDAYLWSILCGVCFVGLLEFSLNMDADHFLPFTRM